MSFTELIELPYRSRDDTAHNTMTNILKPEVLWIEGRCYRVSDSTAQGTAYQEHDLYENDTICDETMDDEEENDCEVVMVDDSRYKTSMHVSKHYLGYIIGKKGVTKMRIERDTRTDIKIPKQGQDGDIVIFGPSASNVKAAHRRINIIVMSSRMKQKPTHFLQIPMSSPETVQRFLEFKEAVLSQCQSRGLEESIFVKPHKLHLTIGVMCLMDQQERAHVLQLLEDAKDKVVMPLLEGNLPPFIRLKGLSYMNDNPAEIHVLYGEVQEEGSSTGLVQQISDKLVCYFDKAGFMDRHEFGRENVKLHVTLMNSRHRQKATGDDDPASRKSRRPRESFDGSEVLQKFADYDFGVSELTCIHLSLLHSKDSDGYYQSTATITLK